MTTKHIMLFILCTGLSFQAQSATQPESTDAREEALFGGEETETRTELEDDLFGEATDSDAPTEDDVSGRLRSRPKRMRPFVTQATASVTSLLPGRAPSFRRRVLLGHTVEV